MNDTLNVLANRARNGDTGARQSLRQELESHLVPLVRCALRRGTGLPGLVNLVRGQLADTDNPQPVDARLAAPRIARLLCAGMVNNLATSTRQETVYGT